MFVVYHAFKGDQFSVQMSKDNPFGGNEADKIIENTIDRDCKTRGGYVGFSANFTSEIIGCMMNDSRRSMCRKLRREHLYRLHPTRPMLLQSVQSPSLNKAVTLPHF